MWMKSSVEVPKGIKYLSEWSDFQLNRYPDHSIIHKQLPGCGFTEYVLTCNFPTVLTSPRKMLMENKKDQHGDNVFLVISEFDREPEIDSDISKPEASRITHQKIKEYAERQDNLLDMEKNAYSKLFNELNDYLSNTYTKGKYPKIIVTYDSAYLVKKVLEQMGCIQDFYFIVDEFQSLLEDARFKADVENEFLTILQDIPKVMYVSATPMLDKYIQRIPELSFLPYYELDWKKLDPTRIKKPDLKVRTMSSINSKLDTIINSYLENNFEKIIVDRGWGFEEVESREAVFYVNSVNHIINAIKRNSLSPDQVNILCSDTPENRKRLSKKLGKEYQIGKVPLRGEPHKMFTFCTRTVYLGADFYSLCARSFIFSDANSDCLSVDISMDLAQILGRQRLEENPWRNSAEFYYRVTCDYKKMTYEDFKKIIDSKLKKSQNLIEAYNSAPDHTKNDTAEVYQREARREKYKMNYVSVNRRVEDKLLIPVINNLVILSEERTFDIQQVDYADRFSVFNSIKSEFLGGIGAEGIVISEFFLEYDKLTTYKEKAKNICEYLLQYPQYFNIIVSNLADHDKIKQQLISIGPEKMKGWGYNITKINKAMGITIFDLETLNDTIYSTFKVSEKYSKKYIKEKLQEVYNSADFKGTAKASDLENWFEMKSIKLTVNGNRENGFELLSVKTKYK